MATRPLGLGLIGCGAFGRFCMDAYSKLDGLRPVAAADAYKPAADRFADEFLNLAVHYSAAELIDRDDVDIVHIATPPATHHGLALRAAKAGKHVLCEKPLAVTVEQADELLAAARDNNVLMPVNFVLRHNPITDAVRAIIDSGVLGRPLHATFENYAADENLRPDHWFWDKDQSGGIFIEHGVHFFDLYRHWLGPGRVIASHVERREGTAQEDRVMCLVRHDDGTVVNHYHGFDQPGPLDRTDHRLLFETGDVTVRGWIPTEMTVRVLTDEDGLQRLKSLVPNAEADVLERLDGAAQHVRGRGRERTVAMRARVTGNAGMAKQDLYAWSVGQLMSDQLAAIRDASHRRIVTEENGRNSLAMAVAAADMAARDTSGA
ncbi:MAG: Gfo/Idh/MocA family oxidoreductase [Planctomycetes bacterium]|nr:Gfo/Idh/MocA family oxidoreductase [Planctomycetota bacterium]